MLAGAAYNPTRERRRKTQRLETQSSIPIPIAQVEAMGIPYLSWEEILPRADIVSLHLPLLPATKYFIDVRGGG